MEKKSQDEHTIVLSDHETQILTRALLEAAQEKPAPQKVPFTGLKKKKKGEHSSGDTQMIY